jgi:arylsulfatase A-like enzyme
LSKVGIPGAPVGLQARDITIIEALKPLGYATGQFGKNHLGDRDEYLPTNHGFDEFFGNLYHLNAEEEPERPYYPKNDEAFVKAYNPRGVLQASADGKITDTGPLNRKRMETIDDETTTAALEFMQRQIKANKPFFVWMNATHMHIFTHVRPSMLGQGGMPGNEYAHGMIEHDGHVGQLLKALDDLGIANDLKSDRYLNVITQLCPSGATDKRFGVPNAPTALASPPRQRPVPGERHSMGGLPGCPWRAA